MSDLAPFVAAALRDKVFCDMKEELAKERAYAQSVQVTSQNRGICYASAQFDENGRRSSCIGTWRVHVNYDECCPINDLATAEIWLGNILLTRFNQSTTRVKIIGSGEQVGTADQRFRPADGKPDPTNMGLHVNFFFSNEAVSWILGKIFIPESANSRSCDVDSLLPQHLLQGQELPLGALNSISSIFVVGFNDVGFCIDRNYRGLQAHFQAIPQLIRSKEHIILETIRRTCGMVSNDKTTGQFASFWADENAEWKVLSIIYEFLQKVNAFEENPRREGVLSALKEPMKYLWRQPNFGTRSFEIIKAILDNTMTVLNARAGGTHEEANPADASIEKLQQLLTRFSEDSLYFIFPTYPLSC